MNKEQLHGFISQSTGNESNICQIYAIKDGEAVLDDNFHGFKTEDAMNVNSVTKGIISRVAVISLYMYGFLSGLYGKARGENHL